jgi:cytochrome c
MSRLSPVLRLAAVLVLLLCAAGVSPARQAPPRVLVFSKTAAYRHESIPAGIAAIRKLGQESGFAVDATEDASAFDDANLKRYRAVIFLSTTGDVLDAAQQDAFERYVQAGGGYVGIHAAADTEYDWPWYGKLAGAWFQSHPQNPNVRKGIFRVVDRDDPSTKGLPARWEREDEFYNFKSINPDIHVLVDIDETSYEGGTNGANHPMSWRHEFDGGRAWYTAMGHTDETYSDPLFLGHLAAGIRWAMGTGALDYGRARPEENRFTKVVLAEGLNEPVELAVLPDERVLFIERGGAVNLYRPDTKRVTRIATIPVSLKYTSGERAEDGLLGLAADPGFARNGWVYMYYSPAGSEPKNVLTRYTMRGDSLDLSSRKVLLEVATQREQCCHTGGSIAFDAKGNLYLSTGDNSNPFATGYAPIDERPGRSPWDAQKSSANTNDLRGKILRIHPEPDGTYTIPAGNLFPPGTPRTRPEIYTMGHRNPYRISVDPKTGYLYWGDVGPDAPADSANRGPAGHDEINQARRPGNYGWPYFVGDNKAYYDVDFTTMTARGRFDPAHPVNDSPNNTGLRELPPAQPAYIWYPAGPSAEFPLVGTGGRTAMAGPVFHREDFQGAARPFPAYYDGKLLIYEWSRGWIMAVTMDEEGDLVSMERFMPSYKFSNPADMQFGPSGDLYLLEYGAGWFQANPDARLVRIEYNAGNRAPEVEVTVDREAGATPLRVALSSAGTHDPDGDSLRYEWTVTGRDGAVVARSAEPSPSLTLERPGVYTAALTVTDPSGTQGTGNVRITAGNEPPRVAIEVTGGNRTFYLPGVPLRYLVHVSDREDGSLESGSIPASRVRVTAEYRQAGAEPAAGGPAASPEDVEAGRKLVEAGTCLSCHQVDRRSIGPAYVEVARKYSGDAGAVAHLVKKIREGGSGVWGTAMMPPHPQLTEEEAARIVAYVLSLADSAAAAPSLPVRGEYTPPAAAAGPAGAVVLRASYTDRGANGVPPATAAGEVVLRAPTLVVSEGELSEGITKFKAPQLPTELTIVSRSGSHSRFERLDLTGFTTASFMVILPPQITPQGGTIEVRLDSPTGPLVGRATVAQPAAAEQAPAPTAVRATLQPTTGVHDVYLVFRNDQAKQGASLFVVLTATFGSDAGGAPTGR